MLFKVIPFLMQNFQDNNYQKLIKTPPSYISIKVP